MNEKIEQWDLEEIPYETTDPHGGWYLHFDMTGESTDNALYLSKANVLPHQAVLMSAAPVLLDALQDILALYYATGKSDFAMIQKAQEAIAQAKG